MLPTLFALTVFLAAALAFLVEPMIGKQLLPVLGGTPGVWNTCLVFFQVVLLLGYFLSHRLTRLPAKAQLGLHVALLLAAVAVLFLGDRLKPQAGLVPTDSEMPVLAVLAVLAAAVGGPFLVLSMTAPLLQSWYARSGRNPYPLYAASNLGSFAGLLSYPLLIEPLLPLAEQRWLWAVAFGVVVTLIAACGVVSLFSGDASESGVEEGTPSDNAEALRDGSQAFSSTPHSALRTPHSPLRWVALAALPSSLLMSVTTHLTTDIAPVPLLWVVPLALYLLSFVIVFARWSDRARKLVGRLTPMFLCFLAVALLMRANTPIIVVAAIHLATFFLVALLCHGELAANRPPPERLTAFYLWLSVGGVVGGLANTLVAPLLFASLGNLEYPLALILAGLVRPPSDVVKSKLKPMDGVWPFALGIFTAVLVVGVPWVFGPPSTNVGDDMQDRLIRGGLSFGIPAAFAFALVWRPVRFALCLAVLLVVGSFAPNPHGTVLATHRNYFGTLRVTESEDGRFHRIVHGTTLHGQQLWPSAGRPDPATYYHRKGPFGRLMEKMPAANRQRVGVVGLGCGATAAYADAGQAWTFYEIDPAVVRVAEDAKYFTFLSTCPADLNVVLGDARRQLVTAPDGGFDVLVLDAFSSDAVPVHLLTREAFELYLRKLKPNGVLALHVSNRYLDLPPLVGRVLHAIEPGLVVKIDDDQIPTEANKATGQTGSTWVIAARRVEDFGPPDPHWQPLRDTPGPVWTDDFSNLLGVWKAGD
ncbi:spermidine synthase [Limnoglobus roseus]|uniref:Ferrichrome ABC transporter, permease protein n=1 Tax=Limnoglobus roseus TaxID=2598579 RepID=A0A5C1A7F0_9BACT|nr:fused MFS/spermidine synthase [Limnoglobus roseus]QEL14127.1 ferrichrome ABC transporter, permease protein [Limnoglobus roseus]